MGIFGSSSTVSTEKQNHSKLIAENPVKAAVACCVTPPAGVRGRIVELTAAIVRAEGSMKTSFLGVENNGVQDLNNHLASLKAEKAMLEMHGGVAGIYPLFHFKEVFSWRNDKYLPKLAIFGLNSPTCGLRATNVSEDRDRWTIEPPHLPWEIGHCFDDVFRGLESGDFGILSNPNHRQYGYLDSWDLNEYREIVARFEGFIPDSVREKISTATPVFGNNIFIVAEVKEWRSEPTFIARRDPLVIGWDGANCWLIDAFDVTPLEALIRSEFTTRS